MKSPLVKTVVPWLLGVATAAVLLTHLPLPLPTADQELMIAYGLLTAFALYFSVLLAEGTLSAAHVAGIVAFLSLNARETSVRGEILWVVFIGGVIGSLAMLLRDNRQPVGTPYTRRDALATVLFVSAGVTLSLFFASEIYLALGMPLPLGLPDADGEINLSNVLAILIFSFAYVIFYFGVFALQAYSEGRSLRRILHESWLEVLVVLVVPVPLGILGAHIRNSLADVAFIILVLGILLAIVGLHRLSIAQFQLRKQLDEVRTLSVITQSMRSHLQLNTLLKNIYLQVSTLLDVNNFVLALYNREKLEFPLIFKDGEQKQTVAPVDDSNATFDLRYTRYPLLSRVLETQTALLFSDDVEAEARELGINLTQPAPHSWMGVPLLAGGRTLGAIAVESSDAGQHFTPNHLRLLNIVAASASIAIENAQLYEQQSQRIHQLGTLNSIASLMSGTLSRDAVLETLIASSGAIAGASAVAVYLWDERQTYLRLARTGGLSQAFADNPPEPLLNSREDLLGQPITIKNILKDPRARSYVPLLMHEKKSAWIELPLLTGSADLGVLVLYYDSHQAFGTEMVELLRTFATQASQALNNARLYSKTDAALEQRVEQLFALAAIGRLLTATMSVDQIGELALSYATDATKSHVGLVMLRDDKGVLRPIATRPPRASERFRLLPAYAQALASGQHVLVPDVRSQSDSVPLAESTQAQLWTPLYSDREWIGLLLLENEIPAAYGDEDVHFAAQIANQVVIALSNARLFQRISEALDRLQVILAAMEEAIVLVDYDGKIALANPRVDLIGLQPDELIGKTVYEIAEQDTSASAERMGFHTPQDLLAVVETLHGRNGHSSFEAVFYAVDAPLGKLYIRRQIIPVRDEQGKAMGALLVFYNKTEEHELERAREDLSRMIVHDLRSPLTAVTTSLKLMRELVPPGDLRAQVQDITETSQRAIRKLLSRVDSLLDISKMESGQLTLDIESTELATLADSVCVELSPLAHELNIEITSQIPDVLPMLSIDADKVERVLSNLVDNALKYAPADSTVMIRAALPDAQQYVRVEIVDQGPGIPDDYKHSLFDRFVQIRGRRGARRGTGLGLTFCRLVVEAHGGRIWIEDNPVGGSIFAFTLPVVGAQTSADPEEAFARSVR